MSFATPCPMGHTRPWASRGEERHRIKSYGSGVGILRGIGPQRAGMADDCCSARIFLKILATKCEKAGFCLP